MSLISQIRSLRTKEVKYFPCLRSHNSYMQIWVLNSALFDGPAENILILLFLLQSFLNFNFFYCLFDFLRPHPQHMEVPRLGVQLELSPPAYTRATATQDPSRVCDLHHSSQQYWILNPLSKARDQTCVLMDASRHC